MPKEAIKYGEECLAIDTKLGDNSSDRCLNLIMGLITDRHSLDGNDSTIVSLYEEYLERLKDNVTKRFGWMNSEERQSFWKNMIYASNPQPIWFRGILLVKRQKFILLYIFLA